MASTPRLWSVSFGVNEAKALKLWLLELSFSPRHEGILKEAGWTQAEIDSVMESIGRKLNIRWRRCPEENEHDDL